MGWFLYPTDVVTTAILRVSFHFFFIFPLPVLLFFVGPAVYLQGLSVFKSLAHPGASSVEAHKDRKEA